MSVEFTEQQRAAIDTRGVNLIVSAGAGSGKTAVMIERICALLREGASLDRMAICTFTNAAAADMRAKLAARLIGEGEALASQTALLSSAQIGTIHSFCMRLVRSYFYVCDLDPAFTVLEEGEARALKGECAEDVIAEAKEADDESFRKLYAAFASARSHKTLKTMILSVADFAVAQPDPLDWLMRKPQKSDAEYRAEGCAALDEKVRDFIVDLRNFAVQAAAAAFYKDCDAAQALIACAEQNMPYTFKTPVLTAKEKENHPEYETYHEQFKAFKEKYGALCEQRQKLLDAPSHESANELCQALGTLTARMLEKYGEVKRARRKADYADLEQCALKVLGDPRGASATDAYDYVFVDEYQDVNPLQEKILSCFHGGMFYVGDVKQSIYGFRMCTPDFFVQKREAYSAGHGAAVGLTANFRSGSKVLDFVNEVFSRLMKKSFGGTDYRDGERMESRSACPSSVSAVLVSRAEKEESPLPDGVYSVRRGESEPVRPELLTEVNEVVKEIERLKETQVPEKGEDGAPTRAANYSDIAVLVRSRGTFTELLERKLCERSIPVCFVAADAPADSFGAVNDLLAFLSLLDNAQDDVSLAAALLSRAYGGFTENELATVRRFGDGAFCTLFYTYAQSGDDEALRVKAAAFTESLTALRQVAAVEDVASLAGEITAKYDSFGEALISGGEREAAALDAFIEHLSLLTEHNTLHEYLRFVRRVGMPPLATAPGMGAVRIMTIHASKGLEFPYVILPNLEKPFNRSDAYAQVVRDKEEGIVLRSYDFENRTVDENPRFILSANKLRRQEASEELRVLYVAMTRAKYGLSLFAVEGKDGGRKEEDALSFLDFLQYDMRRIGRIVQPEAEEEKAAVLPQDEPPDLTLASRLSSGFRAQKDSEHGIVKASVSRIVRHTDAEDASQKPQTVLFEDDRAATDRGSAYHLFMEHARFGVCGEWERLCARFPEEGSLIRRDEMEKAFVALASFIGGRAHYREQPFVFRMPAAELGQTGDHVLVQGVIDLLVEDGDGMLIVDYKTGSPKTTHLETYAKQLALYASAAERILGKKIHGAYLYWFENAQFTEIKRSGTQPNTVLDGKK
ncbi:MAG: UvrD-helicase domain-containing protein [Clostridiales bacterium]|nr:UvrD-helicase domain-containing protein [Clostridiales bacterium]